MARIEETKDLGRSRTWHGGVALAAAGFVAGGLLAHAFAAPAARTGSVQVPSSADVAAVDIVAPQGIGTALPAGSMLPAVQDEAHGSAHLDLYGDGLVVLLVDEPARPAGRDGIMDRAIKVAGIARAQSVDLGDDGRIALLGAAPHGIEAKLQALLAAIGRDPAEGEIGLLAQLLSRDRGDRRIVDLQRALDRADALGEADRFALRDGLASLQQDRAHVRGLFLALLGRVAAGDPPADLGDQLDALDANLLTDLEGLRLSRAIVTALVQQVYQDVLGRAPTASETSGWRGELLGLDGRGSAKLLADYDTLAAALRDRIKG